MSSKVTLRTRKRTKELSHTPLDNTKKQELLALKAASDKTDHNNNSNTCDDFAKEVFAYYQQLSSLGDTHRYTYSKRSRETMVIEKIRHAMYHQAFQNQKKGMSRKKNLIACQQFTDDTTNALIKLGLTLNKLMVNDAHPNDQKNQ